MIDRRASFAASPLPARARHALSEFFRLEAAAGILLIAAAALALLCANSPLQELYDYFRGLPLRVHIGALDISKPLLLWINDGLMAVFFLLISLEIKREVLSGQLSTSAQLRLPLFCASAGVAVPALLYWSINRGDAVAMQGWAVPVATDIAFALGILALLGSRVPLGMKVLLSTIAVVDDLIAILIIAVFYTGALSMTALGWAAAAIVTMLLLNRRGVTALTPYVMLGVVVWVAVLKSGVHATLAGVITGLMVPHAHSRHAQSRQAQRGDAQSGHIDRGDRIDDAIAHSPLESLEHALHPWVAYGILPVFAFANAGLSLGGLGLGDALSAVPLSIILGLVLGKPIGIVGAALLARATGIACFPQGMDVKTMLGLGLLCGVGFTMSLFIASLAFVDEGAVSEASVLGVLLASSVAAVFGYLWLQIVLPARAARADA